MGVGSWADVRWRLGRLALRGRRLGIRGLGAFGPYLVLARRRGGGNRVRPKRSLFLRRRARSLRPCGRQPARHGAPGWGCRVSYPAVRARIAAWRLALGHAFRRRRPASRGAAHFAVRSRSCIRCFEPRTRPGSSLLAPDYGGRPRRAGSTARRGTRRRELSDDASVWQRRWVGELDICGAGAGLRARGAFALRRAPRWWFRGQRRFGPDSRLVFGLNVRFLRPPRWGHELRKPARRSCARRCLS